MLRQDTTLLHLYESFTRPLRAITRPLLANTILMKALYRREGREPYGIGKISNLDTIRFNQVKWMQKSLVVKRIGGGILPNERIDA